MHFAGVSRLHRDPLWLTAKIILGKPLEIFTAGKHQLRVNIPSQRWFVVEMQVPEARGRATPLHDAAIDIGDALRPAPSANSGRASAVSRSRSSSSSRALLQYDSYNPLALRLGDAVGKLLTRCDEPHHSGYVVLD